MMRRDCVPDCKATTQSSNVRYSAAENLRRNVLHRNGGTVLDSNAKLVAGEGREGNGVAGKGQNHCNDEDSLVHHGG